MVDEAADLGSGGGGGLFSMHSLPSRIVDIRDEASRWGGLINQTSGASGVDGWMQDKKSESNEGKK